MTDPTPALASERLLFPDGRPGPLGKTLLVRSTQEPWPTVRRLRLRPLTDWARYEQLRIEVEAGFGVGPEPARAMVAALRERIVRLRLTMLIADDDIGALGWFPWPTRADCARPGWARLQEVDVFPAHRGQGFGDALLAAALEHLAGCGVHTAIIGADEDDWPLDWYRRRGFTAVARVPLSR
ncbi:GNAT family N-acetyltransferase [Kineosporia sp. NBRC 101731]|uniref:GNAT family N-acetyltransferase n=1 Tax=Kineosporia sp. NBRC 101731 TaxID=3032199 RepID=UPI0024A50402|nr:GNAT family N-acetyltransferase [Kineosporia sp. NBRC 101731]GLY28185.1 hypothetical protein Kisp02_15500 [Kineosporia sp. NBRC 101731]